MDFSLVICTRNRARLLEQALASVARIEYPTDRWELMIINNGSSDDTPDVARRFASTVAFEVRCLLETTVGLSAARNRGIREARGRFVVFSDDDQLVDPHLLTEYDRASKRYGGRAFQGQIDLLFPSGRPAWLHGPLEGWLGRTEPLEDGPAAIDLFGGNMAFRRDLFDSQAAFREDLGKGAAGYSEDTELTRRLAAKGEPIVFASRAKVYHVIEADRTTLDFFRKNAFQKGASEGKMLAQAGLVGEIGRAAGSGVGVVKHGALALAARLREDEHRCVLEQVRAANDLGRLAATLAKGRSRLRAALSKFRRAD